MVSTVFATLQAASRVAGKMPGGKGPEVLVDSHLNMSQKCVQVAKDNSILACIRKSLSSKNTEVIMSLYLALLRLYLDYHVSVFGPSLHKGH